MATAVLENINPYAKYGLKRRPTYNEIIGLIGENETITGTQPDRTATHYKSSQIGSFFDGLDSLEILKEQQNRIHERQLRELLMRQNIGGGTYSIARLQQQMREGGGVEAQTQQDNTLADASIQAQLQRRATDYANRQQQTGEAHRQGGFLSRFATPVIEGLRRRMPTAGAETPTEVARMLHEEREPAEYSIATSNSESSEPEMMTARTETPDTNVKINYSTNISNMSVGALKIQLFLRGVDVDAENSFENTRRKGKGKGLTEKQYYSNLANQLIQSGQWQEHIPAEDLRAKIAQYKDKHKARGSRD